MGENTNQNPEPEQDQEQAQVQECASASSCERGSCEGCPSAGGEGSGTPNPATMQAPLNMFSSVKKVIGVVSGKGGVGKSFVTGSLACALQSAGYMVGIMDADITGPSIPKMFGLHGPTKGSELGIFPVHTKNQMPVMSVNLLLDSEEDPVVMRGPVISGTVKQFWSDVLWGDLDYMFVDMPPGTGDVPLTVFQSLPVDGIIIVSSPQELVQMIVKKAYNMAQMMDIPVLGLIENFSYMTCPDCGKKLSVFGESHIEEAAKDIGVPVLGRLPINPVYARLADEGRFEEVGTDGLQEAVELLSQL